MSEPRVFDEVLRTDFSPARGEDSFTFLNRAASPYWERVRAFVDHLFALYPAQHRADLRVRFRDPRWGVHVGAWWELYLFSLFRALGTTVEIHPALTGIDTRPDFRVTIDGESIFVEARHVAAGLDTGGAALGREDWITVPLDELHHPRFMVSVSILARGSNQPRRTAVTAGVLAWLDSLDPDELGNRSVSDLPRFFGEAGEWRFQLRPISMKPASRHRRLIGIFPGAGGFDNTVSALRSALREKGGKYGRPERPFVLAPLVTSGFLSAADVSSALFGTGPRSLADGLWWSKHGVRGTRVSGVLVGDGITPWTAAGALPRLWLNSAARHPLHADLGLPTATLRGNGELAESSKDRSGADVFGLDQQWPGPDPPFRESEP